MQRNSKTLQLEVHISILIITSETLSINSDIARYAESLSFLWIITICLVTHKRHYNVAVDIELMITQNIRFIKDFNYGHASHFVR